MIKRYSVQWNEWFNEFGVDGWYPHPPGGWTEAERRRARIQWGILLGVGATL